MFGFKARAEAEKYKLKYEWAQHRLNQYDALFVKLKEYDRFKLSSGGGIIAYKKNEADKMETEFGKMCLGTCLMVPHEYIKIEVI